MCGSIIKKATDLGSIGIGDTRSKKAREGAQQTAALETQKKAGVLRKKTAKTKKQTGTRDAQIQKFSANVSAGGAKRAANI
jgi:hypothetical protein